MDSKLSETSADFLRTTLQYILKDNYVCDEPQILHNLCLLLAYFLYFWEIKVGLWDHLTVCVSVRVDPLPNNFWIPELVFKKIGMHATVREPISKAYLINSSHQ
jgi:hypothetical protein